MILLSKVIRPLLGVAFNLIFTFVIIFLNGKRKEVAPGTALLSVITERGYKPGQVVIELNQAIIARTKYNETFLTENDTVEILEFVGGG